MKTTSSDFFILALCLCSTSQFASPAFGEALPKSPPSPYSVVDRGPHHRVWVKAVFETNQQGQVFVRTNSYTELATGMHYLEDGQWKESQQGIESYPGGAIARHGAHKVIFASNLNSAGAIDLEMPDGQRMQSHIIGLGYFDAVSGKSVMIAEVKDCQGELVGSNHVVYADAFTDFRADVRYSYAKAGFEQDVILRERPPGPEDWGLDSRTTRLQVLTEFESAPQPSVRTSSLPSGAGDLLTEEYLNFGAMQMVGGKAFVLGEERALGGVAVGKQWLDVGGRRVLVEEVALGAVAQALGKLSRSRQASAQPTGAAAKHKYMASAKRQLPERKPAKTNQGEMQLAKLESPARGVVLDYTTVASATNFTFQGDTTYYISGQVNLSGNTTVEGGL
jgi:hypothetical protein